ncbi:hypothetical protein ACFLZR_00880 [Candidatus Neomarinimicrobiota bacterium]
MKWKHAIFIVAAAGHTFAFAADHSSGVHTGVQREWFRTSRGNLGVLRGSQGLMSIPLAGKLQFGVLFGSARSTTRFSGVIEQADISVDETLPEPIRSKNRLTTLQFVIAYPVLERERITVWARAGLGPEFTSTTQVGQETGMTGNIRQAQLGLYARVDGEVDASPYMPFILAIGFGYRQVGFMNRPITDGADPFRAPFHGTEFRIGFAYVL